MALSVQQDDVLREIQRQTSNASVSIANPDGGKTVIVTIDTPDATYTIDKQSILDTIGGAVPDLAGAITSGNYQRVLNVITKNLPAITNLLFGFSDSGNLSPKFRVRQSEDGEKCYHCKLEHFVTVRRQPVTLFDFILADGGKMKFFTKTRPIGSETIPRNASNRTVTLTSETAVKTDQKDLPYFSSAVFGVTLKQIPATGFANIVAALIRLLLQDLKAEVQN